MRFGIGLLVLGLASGAGPAPLNDPLPPILDLKALPATTSEQGRQAYAKFLFGNLSRAFAFGSNGAFAGMWSAKTSDLARTEALTSCARKGSTDCRLYADDLAVVWPGRGSVSLPTGPQTLLEGSGYAFVPDERFFWHAPATARGVFVWGHGYGGDDKRGVQPPAFCEHSTMMVTVWCT